MGKLFFELQEYLTRAPEQNTVARVCQTSVSFVSVREIGPYSNSNRETMLFVRLLRENRAPS